MLQRLLASNRCLTVLNMNRKLLRSIGRILLKRQRLAMAIASLFAAPAFHSDLQAAKPRSYAQAPDVAQSPIATPPIVSPSLTNQFPNEPSVKNEPVGSPQSTGDDFLSQDEVPPRAPSVNDDAAALYDSSLQPPPSPFADSNTLDAPAFNLATGLAASSLGATRESSSAAPAMLGDFFGGNFGFSSSESATLAVAGGIRQFKIAENVSPMPQDRVFVNYNHFHNSVEDLNGKAYSVDRFTFGGEKTFADRLFSLEARLPFASALNSTIDFDNYVPQATELGNLSFALKVKMIEFDRLLISAGSTMALPTGDDFLIRDSSGESLRVKNDSVHLAPFVGLLARPNSNWFFQGFIQTDFDTRGSRVYNSGVFQGRFQDQNLFFADISAGRWLLRRNVTPRRSFAVAAISELHYTSTMNKTDKVGDITNPNDRINVLNITEGMQFSYGKSALRVGGSAPLRAGVEKLFDAEVFVQASRLW